MTCSTLTDPQRRLLTALTRGPRNVDDLDGWESLDEVRRWGWVFGAEWIELTGAGVVSHRDGRGWAGRQGAADP